MASLSLALLGPPLVQRDARPVDGFESARVRALLFFLAVEADRPHQRDALAGLFWPEQPDQVARSNLRQALANLRQALGDHEATPPFLLITRTTLQFNQASDAELDLARFLALLAACETHNHRRAESCVSCAERLEQAVALYRGSFLAEFFLGDSAEFEAWVVLRRESVHQRAVVALDALVLFHERRGDYERARSYAQRQLELDPWREETHRRLMRLLLLRGDRSAALAQYEACRRVLADELGVEPDEATTALYLQLRDYKPAAASAAPNLPATPRRVELPPQPTAFVGRETELAALGQLLENPACQLITIVGPGGIGKTRLAIQAGNNHARAFADGVVFVALAALNSAEFLVSAFVDALKITIGPQQDPKEQLLERLREQELLLVLDNFEQLLDGALLLADLLQAAPGVTLLVTSRERLDLRWEWIFDLDGLDVPGVGVEVELERFDAVQLFVQRARQLQRQFVLDDVAGPAVAQICRMVEGLPLGVELAAAAVREQSAAQIASSLRDSFLLLATTARDVAPRHRSMRAALDHSWQLLCPEEQHTLRRLAVFRGGFDQIAAAVVAKGTPAMLAALGNKSLLRRSADNRYSMHEAVRQYAEAQLGAAGEHREVAARHLQWAVELGMAAEPALIGPDQNVWFARLDHEHDNMRAALQWALEAPEAEAALLLASSLTRFWSNRGYLAEGRRWLEQAMAHPAYERAPVVAQLRALAGAGLLARLNADFAHARALLEACRDLGEASGERRWVAVALNGLGLVARRQGDLGTAAAFYEQSLFVAREHGERRDVLNALSNLAGVVNSRGDHARAAALYEESLAFSRETGDALGLATDLNNLGNAVFDMGDYARATALYEESCARYHEAGNLYGVSTVTYNLGDLALRTGDLPRSSHYLRTGLALAFDQGAGANCVLYLAKLAELAVKDGKHERAARLWGAAETQRKAIGVAHTPDEQAEHEQETNAVREQLGAEAFAAEWDVGARLSLAEAVAFARMGV